MDISIIIPAYNEERAIREVLKKVLQLSFDSLEKEVIVVDDGSTDETREILKAFPKTKDLKILTHEKNLGKGAAIRSGIKNSSGSIIALQDSDLEYDPELLPKLVSPILEGEDVVFGSRFLGKADNMNFLFYLGNRFLSFLTRVLYRVAITDMETGFKIFRRRVVEGMDLKSTGFEIEPEITARILKKGYRIKEIPIDYVAREKEHKKITPMDGVIAAFILIKYRIL
jgi:glycosyltransferase involved in cell wall biosynthesis